MTGLLIAFTIVILVPLFVGTWRTSLLGLSVQGLLLTALAFGHRHTGAVDLALSAVDLAFLRTLFAPGLLYRAMRRRKVVSRNDVIAPNLVSWTCAIGLVVAAFRVADTLVPTESDDQLLVAVAAAAFSVGLFVLAAARGTFSHIIGLLRIENALALFELGRAHESAPALRVGMSVILLASILFYRWFLDALEPRGEAPPSRPATEIDAL